MNRPTDDSTRSNEQVKAVLEMLRDEGRLAAETDVSGEDARENRRTTRTSAKKGDKKSVLIVDDVACVRKFHAGQIGRLGYQSIEAGEGTEALRLYGENHAGIQGILLDLMMPVMDGCCSSLLPFSGVHQKPKRRNGSLSPLKCDAVLLTDLQSSFEHILLMEIYIIIEIL